MERGRRIPPNELRVWWVDLTRPAAIDVLSDDERARAARFVDPAVARRFVAGRAALRSLLAVELNCAARQVRIGYEPQGKPLIVTEAEPAAVTFNLAHSGDVGLIALYGGSCVGVDLEQIRPVRERAGVMARVATAHERKRVEAGESESEMNQQFFRLWCRKEAVLKALGTGFATAARAVEVLDAAETPVSTPLDDRRWLVRDLSAPPGWHAAVATPADEAVATLRLLNWPLG